MNCQVGVYQSGRRCCCCRGWLPSKSEPSVAFSKDSVCLSSVQSLSCVQLFGTPWTVAHQASLSITNSRSSLKPTSIELVMPSSHLILCHPLLLPLHSFPASRSFLSVCASVNSHLLLLPSHWALLFPVYQLLWSVYFVFTVWN